MAGYKWLEKTQEFTVDPDPKFSNYPSLFKTSKLLVSFCLCFLETRFLCVAKAVLELAL